MADVETKVEKLDERVDSLERQVAIVAAKVDMVIAESQQQREDMRRLRERQDALQARHDSDMREMNKKIDDKFDKLSEQIHTMTIAAVVSFGAIAAAVGGLVFAAFK